MEFTHLHVHTEYSLLDGSNKIKEYVARVKELGMDSAAITDHGVMYGVIDFYRAARAEGINPILGCEVYVAPGSRFDREAGSGEDRYYHLVLLAENNQGYANLMKIVSKGFTEGFYYKPRVDLAVLKEYHEGIIALSACLAGEVARYLQRGMYEDAKAAALRYQDIFGKGNFFLELQDHGIPAQRLVNQELLRMHEETGIDLVATNDVHYTRAEDADPHDILLCLQTNKKLADEDRMRYEGGQYYVKSPEEMAELFPYALEALENTHKIAQRCHVEIEFGVTKLPRFDVPDGLTSWEYLNKLCFEGLEERYQPVTEELKARLNYELSTIKNMGYVDYFLIVWDFIKYARDHDIMVGPGRGSAAGSLVAYTLGITQLDPIRYDLLFERFLNPERVSMPDIDVDFCFERRQEVIEYVRRKYGDDCVVQIVTFGTLAARGVIRDVGRVLDMPYAQVDSIAKMIPQELNITIDKALTMNPELKKAYEEQGSSCATDRSLLTVEKIIEFADCVDVADVEEVLQRQIDYNWAIAEEGMTGNWGAAIGKTLMEAYGNSVHNRAKAMAAAGSDARMNGCELPVVINSGSGNQGMTTSLPVIVYAKELNVSKEMMLRALVVSNLITIHMKTGIGRLSAYCGAISAGCGAGAGICYLYGGRAYEISHVIVNAVAINSGVVCDGAKASCAAKIASAVEAGLLGLQMQKNGKQFYGGDGLVEKGVENTIRNIGEFAKKGMRETDKTIIQIMTR